MFGVVGAGSSLTNINLTDAEVKGNLNVGGPAGWNSGCTISNCTVVDSTVINAYDTTSSNKWTATGGLVGWNAYGTIGYCVADTVVVQSTIEGTGLNDIGVGGLVGIKSYSSSITNHCFTLDVTASATNASNSRIGAFVGQIYKNSTTAIDGYYHNYSHNLLSGLGVNSSSNSGSTATVTQVYELDLNGNDVTMTGGRIYNDMLFAASGITVTLVGVPRTLPTAGSMNNIKIVPTDSTTHTYKYTMRAIDATLSNAAFIEGVHFNEGAITSRYRTRRICGSWRHTPMRQRLLRLDIQATADITFGADDTHTAIGKDSCINSSACLTGGAIRSAA